jgi:urease accessory protein
VSSAVAIANNKSYTKGWQAQLRCQFETGPVRTIVRRNHVGPLTVQRPFYPEGDVAHIYMLHPPGGVVGGDGLQIDMRVESGASGLVTTPGATKFYRSSGQTAQINQNLTCIDGDFEWLPQENIFFDGCKVNLDTKIQITESSSLAFWDVNCFGRLAGAQPFESGSVATQLSLYRDKQFLLHDRFVINGGESLQRVTGLRGHTVSALLLLVPVAEESVAVSHDILAGDSGFCITVIDKIMLVRYIGDSAEQAKQGFTKLWSHHRMSLSQRTPCVPRIWAT